MRIDQQKEAPKLTQRSRMPRSIFDTDAGCHVSDIGSVTETTTLVTPNWLDLSNTEKYRVHGSESDDVEGCLLGRESANSARLNSLGNHIGLAHDGTVVTRVQLKGDSESRIWPVITTLPNDSAYKVNSFTQASGRPTVEKRFKGDFRFGIKPATPLSLSHSRSVPMVLSIAHPLMTLLRINN